jgi:hypothetical protein
MWQRETFPILPGIDALKAGGSMTSREEDKVFQGRMKLVGYLIRWKYFLNIEFGKE